MEPRRLPNGNLLIPLRAEGPDGLVGDGMVEVSPGHPDYERWERYLDQLEAKRAEPPDGSRDHGVTTD